MGTIKPHDYQADSWDDEEHDPRFERLRKQSDKPLSAKGDRRQQDKAWGRAITKWQRSQKREKP